MHCNHPPIGKHKFCLKHWCKAVRTADFRVKDKYTVLELVELWSKQDGKCAITGLPIVAGDTAELDHIVPLASGGSGKIHNVHWLHFSVNKMKWDMSMDEFKQILAELLPRLSEWIKKS